MEFYYGDDYIEENDYDEDYDPGSLLETNEAISFEETLKDCVGPTTLQISIYIGILLGWNILCRFLWITLRYFHSGQWVDHIVCFGCGCGVLYYSIGIDFLIVLWLGLTLFILLLLLDYNKSKYMGYITLAVSICGFFIYELMWDNPVVWHKIRGVQMVVTMKLVSLAFDLDQKRQTLNEQNLTSKENSFGIVPALFPFLGYIFCPANCVLGPWISYDTYIFSLSTNKMDFKWILWTVSNVTVAVGCICFSNCFIQMLCSDHSWKWFVAYRDALSVRCSHYFVSFLSQATMASAGVGFQSEYQANYISPIFGQFVTKPWSIEFPRSLTDVVRCWNIPMHHWLKTYVFRTLKFRGKSPFYAIFGTYIISSLLHGLHLEIYMVLLSLGLFTYIEYMFREKTASIFNTCVMANSCKRPCKQHEHHSTSVFTCILNFSWGFLTVMHLAYLGIVLDSSTDKNYQSQETEFSGESSINKWINLNFLSHWMFLFIYIFYLII